MAIQKSLFKSFGNTVDAPWLAPSPKQAAADKAAAKRAIDDSKDALNANAALESKDVGVGFQCQLRERIMDSRRRALTPDVPSPAMTLAVAAAAVAPVSQAGVASPASSHQELRELRVHEIVKPLSSDDLQRGRGRSAK